MLVHPDGERLIAAEHDGSVTVWNLADGSEQRRLATLLSALELSESRGVHLDLHLDGVRLFSTVGITDTGDVTHVWDLETGHLIERYEYPQVPGRFVGAHETLTANGLYLTLWNFETGDTLRRTHRTDISWHVLGVVDDDALVRGRDTIEVWNVRSGTMRWSAASRAAAIAGELVVLADPGQLTLRTRDGTEVRRIAVSALAHDELDWSLRVGGDTAVVLGAELLAIDLTTGTIRWRIPRPSYASAEVVGEVAIVWSPIEHVSSVWSLATGACLLRTPLKLELSPDGTRAFACDGAQLREWVVDGRDHADRGPAWLEITVAAVPDVIIARDRARTIHVVDHDGVSRHTWGPVPAGPIAGARVAHVEGKTVAISDALTGARAYAIERPLGSLAMSREGLLAGLSRGEASVWQLGEHAAELISAIRPRSERAEVIAIHESRIALAYDKAIEIWRIAPPLRLHTFLSITPAACAAFDPELRWLVSGHFDGALLVRDIVGRKHHATIETGDRPISKLAIQGEVAAVCANCALELWDLATGVKLDEWTDENVYDLVWLDGETIACATEAGLVILRR